MCPAWEWKSVTLSLISLNIGLVKIADLLQNQHLPFQIAPGNEYYSSYSFAFHLYFEVSAMYWNPVWTGSVQNVEQKATLVAPGATKQPRTKRVIESCGTRLMFHSTSLRQHHNQVPSSQ